MVCGYLSLSLSLSLISFYDAVIVTSRYAVVELGEASVDGWSCSHLNKALFSITTEQECKLAVEGLNAYGPHNKIRSSSSSTDNDGSDSNDDGSGVGDGRSGVGDDDNSGGINAKNVAFPLHLRYDEYLTLQPSDDTPALY